ncbi:TPA: hypothetical protein SC008_001756, partial [Campylobacter jejuni]|nr:hypothetical protein [Campylobacter jejuni]
NKKERLAIQFFGHMRTFYFTYPYFKKNILDFNEKNYEIDVFIHTWDEFSAIGKPGTSRAIANQNLHGKKLTSKDIENIINMYKPKRILVEKMTVQYGHFISVQRVCDLREEYEKEFDFKYDQILYIRPDILPYHPLGIKNFIEAHKKIAGEEKVCNSRNVYCANSSMNRLPIIASNVNSGIGELNLIWFCNFSCDILTCQDVVLIPIRYIHEYNFFIWRDSYTEKDLDPKITIYSSEKKYFQQIVL